MNQRPIPTRILFAVLITFVSLSVFLLPTRASANARYQSTSTPLPSPTPTFDSARLNKPNLPDKPNQIELGALKYWGVCMACHGDKGQGLTDEWRGAYRARSDCWQSGCHGENQSPETFFLPQDKPAPALTGKNALTRYKNAQELRDFIFADMPWWNKGSLREDEAWQLTAYVLKLRKVMPANILLSETTASAIPTRYAVKSHEDESAAIMIFASLMVLVAASWVAQDLRKHKSEPEPGDESKGIVAKTQKPNFFHHLHPPTIPAEQSRFRYTLGAGGLAVFFSLILLVTGILEMFYYIPTTEQAAISVETITILVPFGELTRNLHFWSAQALLLTMFVHLLRVLLTGAYARGRRLNYLIGVGMLALIMLLDFTGYVLRWDEGIRWALIVGTNLLKTIPLVGDSIYQLFVGGQSPSSSSIERFYTWHIFVLTLGVIILGVWHAFRTRRDGGIAVAPPGKRIDLERITRFALVRRELLAMVIAGAGLVLISLLFPAPIERPIMQATSELGNARAPWFFLWVQQLLKIGDPFLWGVALPIVLLIVLAILPYILPEARDDELGQWFPRGNRAAQIVTIAFAIAFIILTILALLPSSQL